MNKEIRKGIYRIEIPLPRNPLRALNAYLIRGSDRNLIIDTGFNQAVCRDAMDMAMAKIDFSMDNTDIFLTHCHYDHVGLVGYLAKPETRIYSGDYTIDIIQEKPNFTLYFRQFVLESGLGDMELTQDSTSHLGYRYRPDKINSRNTIRVQDNMMINVGDYQLRCILTTGHAPDHFCLYEENHKLLFSGDHILGSITPNNTIWGTPWETDVDYLGEYLQSLDKVKALDIAVTYPGHRGVISDCYKRIEELRMHHEMRLNNILDILGSKSMTGAQVASQMDWDLDTKNWGAFPTAQKIFSTGEALSHLTHLVYEGVLVKEQHNEVVYYRRDVTS